MSIPLITLRSTVKISVDPRRLQRAQNQTYYILDTPSRTFPHPLIHILGSNGNEYCISITHTSITCNCPDTSLSCKHILFILFHTDSIKLGDQHVTIRPSLLILLFNPVVSIKLERFKLDRQANYICTKYHHSSCHYCPRPISGNIIICSKCGFLGHKICLQLSSDNFNTCPTCSRPFAGIQSSSPNGYRNFANLLRHFHYKTGPHINETPHLNPKAMPPMRQRQSQRSHHRSNNPPNVQRPAHRNVRRRTGQLINPLQWRRREPIIPPIIPQIQIQPQRINPEIILSLPTVIPPSPVRSLFADI